MSVTFPFYGRQQKPARHEGESAERCHRAEPLPAKVGEQVNRAAEEQHAGEKSAPGPASLPAARADEQGQHIEKHAVRQMIAHGSLPITELARGDESVMDWAVSAHGPEGDGGKTGQGGETKQFTIMLHAVMGRQRG